MNTKHKITIGTRGSPLALAQARMVAAKLAVVDPELAEDGSIGIAVIKTTGDHVLDRPLSEIGGKGLFTKEIEEALFDGRIDLAVHSMKDVATVLPDGLSIMAYLEREDPRDVLITAHGCSLKELPTGTIVGSASLRRAAQVRHHRPDLEVISLRGNVQSRLAKLQRGEVGATMLAMAGLNRLGLELADAVVLSPEEMLPAVAQGAIGIETRTDDARTAELVTKLDHPETRLCVEIERLVLRALDGSCRTPIAALAEIEGEELRLRAAVIRPDGSEFVFEQDRGILESSATIGRSVGDRLLARVGGGFFS